MFNLTKTHFKSFLFLISLVMGILSGFSHAGMTRLSDSELDRIQGGESTLTFSGNITRMFLDVNMETDDTIPVFRDEGFIRNDITGNFAQIPRENTSPVQYYTGSQGSGPNTNTNGNDMYWKNITHSGVNGGTLKAKGLIISYEYDDVNKADRKITRIVIGSGNVTGNITADMIRTTGEINPAVLPATDIAQDRINLMRDSLLQNWNRMKLRNTGFFYVYDIKEPRIGLSISAGFTDAEASSLNR